LQCIKFAEAIVPLKKIKFNLESYISLNTYVLEVEYNTKFKRDKV